MAAKKSSRGKARKSVTRAKATRKSAVRSSRKAPSSKLEKLYPGGEGPTPIGIF